MSIRDMCFSALGDARCAEHYLLKHKSSSVSALKVVQRLIVKDSRNLEKAYEDFLTYGNTEAWCEWTG